MNVTNSDSIQLNNNSQKIKIYHLVNSKNEIKGVITLTKIDQQILSAQLFTGSRIGPSIDIKYDDVYSFEIKMTDKNSNNSFINEFIKNVWHDFIFMKENLILIDGDNPKFNNIVTIIGKDKQYFSAIIFPNTNKDKLKYIFGKKTDYNNKKNKPLPTLAQITTKNNSRNFEMKIINHKNATENIKIKAKNHIPRTLREMENHSNNIRVFYYTYKDNNIIGYIILKKIIVTRPRSLISIIGGKDVYDLSINISFPYQKKGYATDFFGQILHKIINEEDAFIYLVDSTGGGIGKKLYGGEKVVEKFDVYCILNNGARGSYLIGRKTDKNKVHYVKLNNQDNWDYIIAISEKENLEKYLKNNPMGNVNDLIKKEQLMELSQEEKRNLKRLQQIEIKI